MRRAAALRRAPLIVMAIMVMCSGRAQAQSQPNGQLWGEFTLSWVRSPRLSYDVDIEPQVLVIVPEGKPDWATLDVTPSLDYVATRWLDVVGEFLAASTKQTNEVNSLELTERAGVRFHLFSRNLSTRLRDRELRELPPSRRLVVRDFARIEQRNIFYSNEEGDSASWRFRNRLEVQFPLNQGNVTVDKTRYALADWEWFVPLNDQPKERFASKQRVRVGLGYRRNFAWRYEALYIWGRSLDTTTDSFTTSDNIIDFKVKRVF
jgi:hypothetical protein